MRLAHDHRVGGLPIGAVGLARAEGEPLMVGVLSTLAGTDTVLGEDSVGGCELVRDERGSTVAGRPNEHGVESTGTAPDTAVRTGRTLVDQGEIEIIGGPLSGPEGVSLRDVAKTGPDITTVDGISGAPEAAMPDPAETYFRFKMVGAKLARLSAKTWSRRGVG